MGPLIYLQQPGPLDPPAWAQQLHGPGRSSQWNLLMAATALTLVPVLVALLPASALLHPRHRRQWDEELTFFPSPGIADFP